jgi:hypothetical protein
MSFKPLTGSNMLSSFVATTVHVLMLLLSLWSASQQCDYRRFTTAAHDGVVGCFRIVVLFVVGIRKYMEYENSND